MLIKGIFSASVFLSGLLLFSVTGLSKAHAVDPAEFRYSSEFIFCAVAHKMNTKPCSEIPAPKIYVGSETPLKQFQDAVEPQWGFRPDGFLNVFVWRLNEIYLLDDAEYYKTTGRAIDDSLAHELAHFVQVKYRNMDLSSDELAEMEAVDVQTWFRDNFIAKAPPADFPCR